MLCKNCNYIITGKENFCPNCASPVKAEAAPKGFEGTCEKPKEVTEHKKTDEDKKESIFAEFEQVHPEEQRASIFYEPQEKQQEKEKDKNKSYAGRIMLLLFLTCIFAAGAFAVADYFGITSTVFSFIESSAAKSEEADEGYYRHENSIKKPDVSYSPVTAYVMSGKGLTLRKGPGNTYAPVGKISDLTAVQIYGESLTEEGWVYIYCAETECYGWLDGSFIAKEQGKTEQESTTDTALLQVN